MKTTAKTLDFQPQFIIDKAGNKTAVILDIKTFEKMQDELEDFYFGTLAEAALEKEEGFVSHDAVKRKVQKKTKK